MTKIAILGRDELEHSFSNISERRRDLSVYIFSEYGNSDFLHAAAICLKTLLRFIAVIDFCYCVQTGILDFEVYDLLHYN